MEAPRVLIILITAGFYLLLNNAIIDKVVCGDSKCEKGLVYSKKCMRDIRSNDMGPCQLESDEMFNKRQLTSMDQYRKRFYTSYITNLIILAIIMFLLKSTDNLIIIGLLLGATIQIFFSMYTSWEDISVNERILVGASSLGVVSGIYYYIIKKGPSF